MLTVEVHARSSTPTTQITPRLTPEFGPHKLALPSHNHSLKESVTNFLQVVTFALPRAMKEMDSDTTCACCSKFGPFDTNLNFFHFHLPNIFVLDFIERGVMFYTNNLVDPSKGAHKLIRTMAMQLRLVLADSFL